MERERCADTNAEWNDALEKAAAAAGTMVWEIYRTKGAPTSHDWEKVRDAIRALKRGKV
jgi:hypothetical protein